MFIFHWKITVISTFFEPLQPWRNHLSVTLHYTAHPTTLYILILVWYNPNCRRFIGIPSKLLRLPVNNEISQATLIPLKAVNRMGIRALIFIALGQRCLESPPNVVSSAHPPWWWVQCNCYMFFFFNLNVLASKPQPSPCLEGGASRIIWNMMTGGHFNVPLVVNIITVNCVHTRIIAFRLIGSVAVAKGWHYISRGVG